MKDGKSLVREGDNRFHSIFLTDGNALFVNPSSLAVALSALGAQAAITGPKGTRTVKIEELYQVPKTEADGELTIKPGEVLTKVTIPAAKGKNASYEARHKQAQDWPIVLASANVVLDGDVVSAATIFIYGVAPIPWKSARRESDRGQAGDDRDRGRGRRGRRGRGCSAIDECLQGSSRQDGRQASLAGCRGQPILGGGVIA